MKNFLNCLAMVIVVGAIGGCGAAAIESPPPADGQPAAMTDTSQMKTRLTEIAESGQAGSGIGGLEEGIKQMGNADLEKKLEQLKAADQAGKTDRVKAIATDMANTL